MGYPNGLGSLEAAVRKACAAEQEWPAQVAAGIYAGVDYAIDHPEIAQAFALHDLFGPADPQRYRSVITKFAGHLRSKAPADKRLPGSTDEALVGGIVGLVGDHLRLDRRDRLRELRPDLVLLTLLPYLGFEEAQKWANSREA